METVKLTDLKFTQSTINDTFADGRKVSDLVANIKDGSVKPTDLPALNVFKDEKGQLWSLDNRRLFALKQATNGKLAIKVVVHDASDSARLDEFHRKFTTSVQGSSIRVKDGKPTRFPRKGRNGAFFIFTKDHKKKYWCQLSAKEKEMCKEVAESMSPDDGGNAMKDAIKDAEKHKADDAEKALDAEATEPQDEAERAVDEGAREAANPQVRELRRQLGQVIARQHSAKRSLKESDEAVRRHKDQREADEPRLREMRQENAQARQRAAANAREEAAAREEQTRRQHEQRERALQRERQHEVERQRLMQRQQQEAAAAERERRTRDDEYHRYRQPSLPYDDRHLMPYDDGHLWPTHTPSDHFHRQPHVHSPSPAAPSQTHVYHGNTWNDFQHANAGRGWTKAEMSANWTTHKATL